MHLGQRLRLAGATVAVAGVGLGAAGLVTATADAGGAVASFVGFGPQRIVHGSRLGAPLNPTASLILLDSGEQTSKTYCIDLTHPLDVDEPHMESAWSPETVGGNIAQINWIIHHSYPVFDDLEALGNAAGLDFHLDGTARLTPTQAVAATQAAIWHFSDAFLLDGIGNEPEVVALYQYLVDPAVNLGLTEEPAPTLELAPRVVNGSAGDTLGPVRVATSATSVALSLTGPGLLLVNGVAGSVAHNGDAVEVEVPSDQPAGGAVVHANASAPVQTGRIFVRAVDPEGAQKQIVAAGGLALVDDAATFTWTGAAPWARAEPSCRSGGVEVTLGNDGGRSISFTVQNAATGFTQDSLIVGPGATRTVLVPLAAGAAFDIVASSGSWSERFTGVLDCPVATTTTVAVTTTAPTTTVPTTTVATTTATTATTTATTATTTATTAATTAATTVATTAATTVATTTTTEAPPVVQVAGVQVTRPQVAAASALPSTGSNSEQLIRWALALMALGATLAVAPTLCSFAGSRRRNR